MIAAPATTDVAVDDDARRTVRWVTWLFVLEILLQRFAVPGQPVALLLPVIVVWTVLALRRGVMEIDSRRTLAWVAAVCVSGTALVAQTAFLPAPLISADSWMLLIAVWIPAMARFVDRRPSTYLLVVRRVVDLLCILAAACIVMMVSQLVGLAYTDVLAEFVPSNLLIQFFNTSYPIEYGSSIFRANAWVGLEPSIVSFLLGVGLLAAVLSRTHWWKLLLLAIGMFCTFGGSGFIVVVVGLLAMLFFPARRLLVRYAAAAGVVLVLALTTPLVRPLIDRASTEFFDTNSSASLRAVQAYIALWPRWSGDTLGVLIGRGAGSAQRYADDLGIADLLVPTPARTLFDFGLIAGTVLIVVLLFFYLDGPSASIAFTSFFSLWVFQPGGSQIVFALPVMVLVTFFAPRVGHLHGETLRGHEFGEPAADLAIAADDQRGAPGARALRRHARLLLGS